MKDVEFIGAKVALFIGDRLLVILRDVDRDIPWPGMWDIPGGGREAGETPEEVVIREAHEEVGLKLRAEQFVWKRECISSSGKPVYFFVAHLPEEAAEDVVFGDEGQRWELWDLEKFMTHKKVVPYFQTRLAAYLAARDDHRS
ncbi:MAG: NUDIX hydrolase [Pseudomonadota bacterium]